MNSDQLAGQNVNPQQWMKTAGSFDVSGTTANNYLRVTLRHDYLRNLWDFFIDGKLVAVNLAFEGRGANLNLQVLLTNEELEPYRAALRLMQRAQTPEQRQSASELGNATTLAGEA